VESIGATARASGLTVSALRFYDGAGVLVPAHVDPRSGYRYYAPDQVAVARLVAALRRTGMPLAGIRAVVSHRHDRAEVAALLSAHLRELERGVADARRLLAGVPSLLEESPAMTPPSSLCVLTDLPRVLRAVRFAAGTDPGFPVLTGVLLEVADGTLTAVATDRYRMAVASALATGSLSAVVPAELADRLAALDGEVELTVSGGRVTARAGATTVEGAVLDGAFPDRSRLLPTAPATPVVVGVPALRAAVAAGGTRTVRREADGADVADVAVTVLSVDDGGRLVVDAGRPGIGVDVEFLLQAADAGGPGQLVLDLDGPLAPVRIRPADRDDAFSLLMPVRLPPARTDGASAAGA
jgi:DNA-binding transcriptional MerR regulator